MGEATIRTGLLILGLRQKDGLGVAEGLPGAGVGFEEDALLRYPACVCLRMLALLGVSLSEVALFQRCYTKNECMLGS